MTNRVETGTCTAWLTASWMSPEDLDQRKGAELAGYLAYSTPETDMAQHGWTKVGTAQIAICLDAPRVLIENKIASLQTQRQKILADSQLAATKIEGEIQSLLAISFDETSK